MGETEAHKGGVTQSHPDLLLHRCGLHPTYWVDVLQDLNSVKASALDAECLDPRMTMMGTEGLSFVQYRALGGYAGVSFFGWHALAQLPSRQGSYFDLPQLRYWPGVSKGAEDRAQPHTDPEMPPNWPFHGAATPRLAKPIQCPAAHRLLHLQPHNMELKVRPSMSGCHGMNLATATATLVCSVLRAQLFTPLHSTGDCTAGDGWWEPHWDHSQKRLTAKQVWRGEEIRLAMLGRALGCHHVP